MDTALDRASHVPYVYLCVCLFACLLEDIADKHKDAGQRVLLQISASLAGGRSAYQHRYVGLNLVSCILSIWLTSSNVDNVIGYLKTSYMVFRILTLNFKIKLHYNMYRYFQSHTTHSFRSTFVCLLVSTSFVVFITPTGQDNNINRNQYREGYLHLITL
jgi:hypothetical protein